MSSATGHPRALYVSYDGAQEPLGRTQVLPYVRRLAKDYQIGLISFEKSPPDDALREQLAGLGIDWWPLRYHKRPPALSTLFDVLAGRRAVIRAVSGSKLAIIHARSYVPALIALLARRRTGGRLLFDIRGFWADERVEGGLWRPGGLLYRIAKACERRFFERADAIVTLSDASVTQIKSWAGRREVPIEVIPTCVELDRFPARPARSGGPHTVWCGSTGTWYRFDLAPPVAAALSLPLTVITPRVELAREMLNGYPASVRSVSPDEVPAQLFAGDIGLCLVSSTFSKVASAPTRFAEYLAAGMPVVVTPAVGDLETLVEQREVGVVLRGDDQRSLASAAAQIIELSSDRELPERCRSLARERFDVDAGAERYRSLYRHLAECARVRP